VAFLAFAFFLACFVAIVVSYIATRRTSEEELRRRMAEWADGPYGYTAPLRRAPLPFLVSSVFGVLLGASLLVLEYVESEALDLLAVFSGLAWGVTLALGYYAARRGRPAFLLDRRLRDEPR
jgi:hypothetical protein